MSSPSPKKKLFVRRNRLRRRDGEQQGIEDGNGGTFNSDPEYKMQEKQCQECNSTSKISYRPLVNENGSYLCDVCYKTKFPATAMCDMTQNQNLIVSKFHERDIRKKQNLLAKKKDEEDGNVKSNRYTEEEECCSCLEKGIYRQCCKKYYCHLCYYNQARACPGCGVPIHRSGVTIGRSKPKKIAVLASWGISCYIVLMLLSITALFIAHNQTSPETVWEGTCHGWFPSCDRPVCIDLDTSTSEGDTIEMPVKYNFCSINHTVNKVIGKTCIIDSQLYRESNGFLGYDLCIETGRDKKTNEISTLSNEDFVDGAYIFEDNFDYWKNSTDYNNNLSVIMKSARWSHMINAETSGICGFNTLVRSYEVEMPPSREVNAFKIPSALVFSGVQNRFAETIDLDLQFGGRVEFYIKFAPIVENELETECKSAFNGDIKLSYSLDHGISWSTIKPYPVWKYRRNSFSFVNQTIPRQAHSNQTRFRWEQPTFDSIRDFWALDDVRIYHQFHPNWRKGDKFKGRKSTRQSNEQHEQCCLDTEQCLDFPNKKNLEACGTLSAESGSTYRMKIVDMFIVAAVMLTLSTKACRDFQRWFRIQISDSRVVADERCILYHKEQLSTLKNYNFHVSRSWQISAFILLSMPFASNCIFLCWYIYSSEYYDKRSIELHFCILAIGLDFWTIRSLSMNVLHFWPCHVPPQIRVDKSYDNYVLWIGNDSVPILDISSIELFSQRFYVTMFICVFVSGLPLAIWSILIKALQLSYESYIVILELLGCSLIMRSILGPKWFIDIYLSLTWIFTPSAKARDEMGRAIEKPSVRHVVTNFTILAVALFFLLILSFQPLRRASALVKISIFIVTTITGSICGSLLGMLRGLPVAPEIHLTTWPTEGYSFVNERCIPRPHIWANIFAGGMNSFHLHVLQVMRQQEFRELLSGSDELEKLNSIYDNS